MDIRHIRKDYTLHRLANDTFPAEPVEWFGMWLDDAIQSGEPEATAMVVSTVSQEGKPSARVVLLKSFDENGFVFFTNYLSRKGQQLELNPAAAIVFFWPLTERQVRIEGEVEKVSAGESDAYFSSRPAESRVNAIVSPQSRPITSRSELESEREKLLSKNEPLQRPAHWGGYRLRPVLVEFWQGGPARLHDRIQYTLQPGAEWKISRLAP